MTLDKTKQTEKNPYANKTKPVQKKSKKSVANLPAGQ